MLRRSKRVCKTNIAENNPHELPIKRKRIHHAKDTDDEQFNGDDISSDDEFSSVQSTKVKETCALNLSESDSDNDVQDSNMMKSRLPQQSDTESEDNNTICQTNFDFTTVLNPQNITKFTKCDVKPKTVDTTKENNPNNIDVAKLLSVGEGINLSAVLDVADDTVEEKSKEDDNYTIPDMVEVTVKLPNDIKCKKGQDMQNVLRRRMNTICKETQVLIHKVNLLLWISYGNHLNRILNSPEVMGSALSLVPSKNAYPPKQCDLSYLENFIKWFSKKIKLLSKTDPLCEITVLSLVENFSKHEAKTIYEMIAMFISMLRSLGLNARLVININAVPIKPTSEQLLGPLTNEDHIIPSTSKSKVDTKQKTTTNSEYFDKKSNKSQTDSTKSHRKKSKSLNNNSNKKKKNYEEIISSTDEEDNVFIKRKKKTKSKYFEKPSTILKNSKSVDKKNKNNISKTNEKIDRRVLSTDEDDNTLIENSEIVTKKKVKHDFWVEVFLEMEEKWFCVDVISQRLHCIKEIYVSWLIL